MEAQEQYILLSNCDFLNLVGMKYSMICEAKQESFIEWICSLVSTGLLKGVFLESGSPEEFALLPKLARAQPAVDRKALAGASSVEEALSIAQKSTVAS
jgi:hypothetical protein